MQEPFAPSGGTPILPPSYLTVYFLIFFIFLGGLYIYFYRKRRPTLLWERAKLLIILALALKTTVIAGGGLLAAYWLIPTPGIRRTTPIKDGGNFSPTDKIEIVFDRPVSRGALEKTISPETPGHWVFENSVYTTHLYRNLVFYPTNSLQPDTTYTIRLTGIRNLTKISKPYDYQFEFKTQPSPKIIAVSPVSGQREVDIDSEIKVTLDNKNDGISDFTFQFTPSFEHEIKLDSSKKIYTITPKNKLNAGTEYNLKIQRSDIVQNLDEKTVVERKGSTQEYDGNFTTKQSPPGLLQNISQFFAPKEPLKVVNFDPQNEWTAVSVHSPIKVTFSEEVQKNSAEQRFSITPKVDGSFSWDHNTLIFTPKSPLDFTTTYSIGIATGVSSNNASNSNEEFKSEFSTQNTTTKLDMPPYLQKYTLSCEIAALRMALNYKGINVSEDDLIPKVGTDPTPHNGNVWGNPNNAFVGNIRGTQMKNGYGVHWDPIARVAREYRDAQAFQGWSIEKLTEAIVNKNPVVIWVYSHGGLPTSWKTPDGTEIYAVRDEHAVTVVGFVGPANSPTQLIINDPLIGQVYWSRPLFDKKWKIFNNSGVIVY